MSKLHELLTQENYKNGNGYDLLASEIDCVTTYKHVYDGFYKASCAACGGDLGSRSCGWPIAGLVETCPKCLKKNLLLRNDIEYVDKQFEKANSQGHEIRMLKEQVDKLEMYRDSEPAQLLKEIEQLKARLKEIKKVVAG